MAYLALYRRYRPTDFEHLIGQDHIVKTLTNQITENRLGHAYLFTGTRGTGKTSCAKTFAKAVNCLDSKNGSPCGKCSACLALSDPSNIDVIEIDAASNNGVNEIRELRENVQYPPVSVKYKVYIIDEVHMLTGAAFNALLKTLEEPPKHAIFILATTEAHKIPATILSRCMRFDFKLISTEQIAELISNIYDEQGKEYEKEAVTAIAKAGEGSIRDALSIADIALSHNKGKLTYKDVTEILGSSNYELITEFTQNVLSGNTGKVLEIINALSEMGKSMGVLTKDVTAYLRDLIVAKTCGEKANQILALPQARFEKITEIANGTNEARILRALEIFASAESALKYTTHPRVVFESLSIKATRPDSDYDFDALIARVKTLEDAINNGVKVTAENIEKPAVKVENTEKLTNDNAKGLTLRALRSNGAELLWSVMQNASIEVNGGILSIYTDSESDRAYLNKDTIKEKLKACINGYGDYEIVIKEPDASKKANEINDAVDQVKKLFGEDIVIIKN